MLVYHGHTAVVYALAFSPDGSVLASGGRDGAVHLWADTPPPVDPTETRPDRPAVNALTYLPGGRLVVAAGGGWCLGWAGGDPGPVTFLSSDGDPTAVAVAGPDLLVVGTGHRFKPTPGVLKLYDLKADRRVPTVFREPNGVRAVAGCPAKGLVAWATGHKKVTVWDVRRPDPLHFPLTHTSPAVALAPDGATLAAAVDWGVKLFDLAKKRERATLKGHKGAVAAVAFSPDGRTLATGSWDGTVRLWDAATGAEAGGYAWPVGKVYSLAYAPDGGRLAAGGDTGAVVVWDVG